MKKTPQRYGNAAFTLIEMMVVMAILGVFLSMTGIVSQGAIDMNNRAKSRVSSERNASAFIQQFRMDQEMRLIRTEARPRIEKNKGNDEFSLFTLRQGYALHSSTADRRVSLVGYRIENHQLERAAVGFAFGSDTARPSDASGTLSLKDMPANGPESPPDTAFQTIAPGILRLEFSFLIRENGKSVLRAGPPADLTRIEAVVATLVTLDPYRRRPLDDSMLKSLSAQFPDAEDNEMPMEKWTAIAANLAAQLPSLPKSALTEVRVHHGIFKTLNEGILP